MRKFFKNYIGKVEPCILQTFNCDVQHLIKISNAGPDSCWLQIKQSNKIIGICVYNLDLSQYQFRRINLLHISIQKMALFGKALLSSMKYILMHDNCNQIYCSLAQYQDEASQFVTSEKIVTASTSQGFKFKQQLNEYNEETGQSKRRIIYGYSRPGDILVAQSREAGDDCAVIIK